MLREHTTALANAIEPCLNQVATALLEKNLISLDVISKILETTGVPSIDKARRLVTNLQYSLKSLSECGSSDQYLIDICRVLHSQGDNALRGIANSIQQNLGK